MNNRPKALKHIGWSHNPSQFQNQPKSFPAPAHIDERKEKHETLTNCKLHCGVRGVRCLCSFLDRLRPADADALRNPQRQLASDRYAL